MTVWRKREQCPPHQRDKQEAGSRKQEAGSRKQEAGSRKQEAGSRKQEAGSRKQERLTKTDGLPNIT
ncbi:hypothetical protein [Aeromonas veronii]|uniref:hypothetical protein n=1 Tax=Aeromonas veronii TaxID=654 RepID=UPI0011B257FD|nr:hypothetical protein [Aeromonas veronii]